MGQVPSPNGELMLFIRNNSIIVDRGISPSSAKSRQSYDLSAERMLLWVDVSRVPREASIYSASLVIPVIGPVGRAVEVLVGRILRDWDPAVATWTTRKPGREWSSPGGLDGVDHAPWISTAVAVPGGTTPAMPVHVSVDVTADIRAFQVSRVRPGWMLSGNARVGSARNVQLQAAPALAVKYSGDKSASHQAGLMPGGM